MQPLLTILICLILAYLLSELFTLIGVPKMVGQILAGLMLSFGAVKSLVFSESSMEILSFLANLGIILLFYYVGLEMKFDVFTKNIKKSFMVSAFNTLLPLAVGFTVMKFIFGFSSMTSIIIGMSLAVSAQSASAEILDELKLLKSRIGSFIITAGAVDDLFEIFLITVLISSFHLFVNQVGLLRFIIDVCVFIAFTIIIKIWFIPYTLKFFDKEKSSTSRFMTSMIIMLMFAYFSDLLGIGSLIGAMIAGVVMKQTIFKDVRIPNWEEYDIARSIHIIAFGFLIPLFFVWVGANTNILLLQSNFNYTIIFFIIAVVCTVAGSAIAVVLSKGTLKEGLVVGWGLTTKGDVELVIGVLALKSGIISPEIFTALVMMSILTSIISPIIFKKLIVNYHNRIIRKHPA